MSAHQPPKRKKSGAENRKAKSARQEEEKKLGDAMMNYFSGKKKEISKEIHETEEVATNEQVIAGEEDCFIELDTMKSKATANDPSSGSFNVCASDTKITVINSEGNSDMPFDNADEIESGNEMNKMNDEYETDENISEILVTEFNEEVAFNSEDKVSNLNEKSHITFPISQSIAIDKEQNTFDPASIVGLNLNVEEKQIFYHDRNNRRKWVSYSLSNDALYCIPCLLFTGASSRGELQRANQGHAFACTGFSNWKKQYEAVTKHESSAAHINAKIADALFLQKRTVNEFMEQQRLIESDRRKKEVLSNRQVMKRIVDTITFLGKQGLAFRGHRERLNRPALNTGNFLETLNYLSKYDPAINSHLEKAIFGQKKIEGKEGGKRGAKGRGSKLTFLSKSSQNTVINIIGEEIVSEIVKMIRDCRAWALIADTTPDVSKHEQLSICIRVVTRAGQCSENLLFCKRASGTTALEIYNCIAAALASKEISFGKLVAQTYDGASNMSGCYNGLQAIIKEKVGDHVVYVHCYAHTLNLVLSDSAGASVEVIKLFDNLEKLYNLFRKSRGSTTF
eukprot:gene13730-15162_t